MKALSEELENPLNVHRWRKLEGSDPSTFEMIQKIQTLQKRLISKTEEVVEKDLLIQEKEKLYMELKAILARQPGPEVAEQVSMYQQNLREKTRQLKAMASELNMYQAQTAEYKYEIERLTRDAQDLKRKYYEAKEESSWSERGIRGAGGEGGAARFHAGAVHLGAGSVSRNADTRSAPTSCNRSHPPPRQRPRAASRGSIIQHSYYSVLHAAKDTNVGQRRSSLTGPARSSWRRTPRCQSAPQPSRNHPWR